MILKKILKPLASLKLTVVIFALSIFLIFAGTLAQVHSGIWTVVDQYFRSLVVTIPLQIFAPVDILRIPGAIWFPGGLTLGTLMFINLIAAHVVRFKFTKKRFGIILTHLGVILLLVGEFVTGFAAREGNMTIREGETVNFVVDIRSSELAIVDQSDPNDDLVTVVPDHFFKTHSSVSDEKLPFDIEVVEWLPNSQVLGPMQTPPDRKGLADAGSASQLSAIPLPVANGVDGANTDAPSAYLKLSTKDGKALGTYLLSVYLERPQAVMIDDQTYWLSLRFTRTYKPYSIKLIDFKHDLFTGTQMARNYSSDIQLIDTGRNVDRETKIYMNHPLRHAGETFYQASFLQGDAGTVLQVVQNPGWLIPYISCIMVTLGMLIHFGARLAPKKSSRRKGS